jgi:hypothetical protein
VTHPEDVVRRGLGDAEKPLQATRDGEPPTARLHVYDLGGEASTTSAADVEYRTYSNG